MPQGQGQLLTSSTSGSRGSEGLSPGALSDFDDVVAMLPSDDVGAMHPIAEATEGSDAVSDAAARALASSADSTGMAALASSPAGDAVHAEVAVLAGSPVNSANAAPAPAGGVPLVSRPSSSSGGSVTSPLETPNVFDSGADQQSSQPRLNSSIPSISSDRTAPSARLPSPALARSGPNSVPAAGRQMLSAAGGEAGSSGEGSASGSCSYSSAALSLEDSGVGALDREELIAASLAEEEGSSDGDGAPGRDSTGSERESPHPEHTGLHAEFPQPEHTIS